MLNCYSYKFNIGLVYKSMSQSYRSYDKYRSMFYDILVFTVKDLLSGRPECNVIIESKEHDRMVNMDTGRLHGGVKEYFASKGVITDHSSLKTYLDGMEDRLMISVFIDVYNDLTDFLNAHAVDNRVNVISLNIRRTDTLEVILKVFRRY